MTPSPLVSVGVTRSMWCAANSKLWRANIDSQLCAQISRSRTERNLSAPVKWLVRTRQSRVRQQTRRTSGPLSIWTVRIGSPPLSQVRISHLRSLFSVLISPSAIHRTAPEDNTGNRYCIYSLRSPSHIAGAKLLPKNNVVLSVRENGAVSHLLWNGREFKFENTVELAKTSLEYFVSTK